MIDALLSEDGGIARYKGHHALLGHVVTLRLFVDDAFSEQGSRFDRSARVMTRIRDTHVVSILDYGFQDEVPCIVTEHVPGEPLRRVLESEGALPWPRAMRLYRGIVRGLLAIHEAKVLHRNLNPAHVVVEEAGESERVRLVDLSFAKPMDPDEVRITRAGVAVGAPGYMAPEQLMGEDALVQSDLYAAGVVLFEMLTGSLPAQSTSQSELIRHHVARPSPPRAPAGMPPLPPRLQSLCVDSLAVKVETRPATAAEVLHRLDQVPKAPGQTPPKARKVAPSEIRMQTPPTEPAEKRVRLRTPAVAWRALAARSNLRREEPDPSLRGGRLVRAVLIARLAPGQLAKPDVAQWLAVQLADLGRGFHVRERFWTAFIASETAEDAEREVMRLRHRLAARFPKARLVHRIVEGLTITRAMLEGQVPPPAEVLATLEEAAQDD